MDNNGFKIENNIFRLELSAVRVPAVIESKKNDWVAFGEDNCYPQYLLDLLQNSAKHNAIVKGKVSYICGNGIEADVTGSVEQKALVNKIIKRSDLNEVIKRCSYDYEVHNMMCIHVAPSKDGRLPYIAHINTANVRISKDGEGLYYSNDWSKYRQTEKETGFKELPLYDEKTKTGHLLYRRYTPDIKYYALPEYVGAVPYIDIDKRIASFHLNNLANGFSAGTLINFNTGEPTVEEQKVIEGKLKKKFAGDDKAGEIVITFSNGQDRAPQVLSLQSNNFDKLFETLKQTTNDEIFTGHNVTSPMLFGVKTEGQLGGRTELVEAHELFKVQYVEPRQREIEGFFNDILLDFELGFTIELQGKSSINERLSEQTLTQILTQDELRAIAGYEPLGKEEEKIQMRKFELESDPVLIELLKVRKDESSYEVLQARGEVFSSESAKLKELGYRMGFASLTEKEKQALDIISKNNKASIIELSKALEIDLKQAEEMISKLFDLGYLKGSIGIEIQVTGKGETQIGTLKEVIETKYRYALRTNAPQLVQGGKSRPFCASLMTSGGLYDREDIDRISMAQGRDVWRYRGGWYTNPNTDVPQPSCRHMWEQVIVRRKV